MSKLSIFALAFILGCVLAGVQGGVSRDAVVERVNALREIGVVKDVRDYVSKHPNMKFERLIKLPSGRSGSQTVRYTLGSRVSGDRLIAQGADVYAYPALKDVSIQLTYPEKGVGSIVTYVEISCIQDNNQGNAYVVSGGIGQRMISIILEAPQTENFSYTVQYYGRD